MRINVITTNDHSQIGHKHVLEKFSVKNAQFPRRFCLTLQAPTTVVVSGEL